MSSRATVASTSGRALGSNASWPFSVRATQGREQGPFVPLGKRPQPGEGLRIGQAGPIQFLRSPVDLEVLLSHIDVAESTVVDTHGGTVRCLGRPDIECIIIVAGGEHAPGELE